MSADSLPPDGPENGRTVDGAPREQLPRRDPRRNVDLPAVALFADGSPLAVTVLDLSYDGCKISSSVALLPGVALTLSVLGLGKMPAHVRWCSDGHAGLSFRPVPTDEQPEVPRQHERTALRTMITVRRSRRQNFEVQALDVSASGCRFEFVDRPSVGERQWVKFKGFDAIEAEVSWLEGSSAGLHFLRPIHPAVFELLIAKLK